MKRRRPVVDRREEASAAVERSRSERSQAAFIAARVDRIREELLAHGRVNGFEQRVRLAFKESR